MLAVPKSWVGEAAPAGRCRTSSSAATGGSTVPSCSNGSPSRRRSASAAGCPMIAALLGLHFADREADRALVGSLAADAHSPNIRLADEHDLADRAVAGLADQPRRVPLNGGRGDLLAVEGLDLHHDVDAARRPLLELLRDPVDTSPKQLAVLHAATLPRVARAS